MKVLLFSCYKGFYWTKKVSVYNGYQKDYSHIENEKDIPYFSQYKTLQTFVTTTNENSTHVQILKKIFILFQQ